jgi:hypothetical protein
LALSHFSRTDKERLAKPHAVLLFVIIAVPLRLRRAHHELASWNPNQFHADRVDQLFARFRFNFLSGGQAGREHERCKRDEYTEN